MGRTIAGDFAHATLAMGRFLWASANSSGDAADLQNHVGRHCAAAPEVFAQAADLPGPGDESAGLADMGADLGPDGAHLAGVAAGLQRIAVAARSTGFSFGRNSGRKTGRARSALVI